MRLFIKKMYKEGKIKITNPSEEICTAYLEKSDKSIISAKTLQEIQNYDDAVALTYYSMYYSALALLYKSGIKSKNHTATIILLKELYGIENRTIEEAKKERVDKQYYIDFKVARDEVNKGIEIAEEFNIIIREYIAKIKQKQITEVQEKMRKIIE
ncbi:MAG: HEPN domain-containing protein [Candidatus Woesearchaeota archaeon]